MSLLPLIDPLPAIIAAGAIALLFAHAAFAKFADLALLEQHLSGYGVPQPLLVAAARALPLLEACIALLLLSPMRPLAAFGAMLLLTLYGGAMAWHRRHDHVLDCGCGGEPLPVSWALVGRNAGLAALALLAAAPIAERALDTADMAVAGAALLLATLLYAAFNQVLRHQAGMRRRDLSRSTTWMQ